MSKFSSLPCFIFLTFLFTACEDNNQTSAHENSESILRDAVPVNSKDQAELQKETEALKIKREEGKLELEKMRKDAASLKERVEALEEGDLAKASSGNTEDASIDNTARKASDLIPSNSANTNSSAKAQMELQLITLNLKRLCDMADAKMDLTGVKSIGFDELVGPGKSLPSLIIQAGEIYTGLVFTPEKSIYAVTTLDGRTVRYERGK